jgi:hypothetical protein
LDGVAPRHNKSQHDESNQVSHDFPVG